MSDPDVAGAEITVTIMGNCGFPHKSFEEWQKCRACGAPRPQNWRWWIDPMALLADGYEIRNGELERVKTHDSRAP